MSRDNDVFKVLVTKGNQAVLGPNLKVDNLADGQIGVFNSDTNVSLNAASAANTKEFYLAVGIHTGGVLTSIRQSSGNDIQGDKISGYTYKPHTAGQPQIVEVEVASAKCDADYALKIEFFNAKIWRNMGYTPYSHTFNIKTACCVDCADDCNTAEPAEMVKLFTQRINGSNVELVSAQAVAVDAIVAATHGTSINYAAGAIITNLNDINAIVAFNKKQTNKIKIKLRLTSKPIPMSGNFGGIDLKYYNQRETTMVVSFADGFGCGGTITTTQEAAFEQGNGYDIQQREYKTLGWQSDSGAYRTSSVTGLPWSNIKFFANADTKYDKIALEYQHEAQGGWLDYKNELATEIAVPEADTVTRNGLLTILDVFAVKVGKDAKLDDAAIANVNPAVVEQVEDINDVTKDGI